MPFKSKQQWKYFFANPELKDKAHEWAHETKKEFKDLPKKVKKKKKKTAELVLDALTNTLFGFKD